ncbi:hypothetical protein EAH89_22005 [Roseomonas nepalensis]|uniref:Uncharacterized protein n=1 Tax=Muricoccus nepalensis TaxID=1854500 RepID=A0A502FIL5_9PROT|nr:hypothetical protein [Roseomonas nepalensis]TPG49234.1 hypothetical protein EAH89_22005 [Roseomonas nepalensis]
MTELERLRGLLAAEKVKLGINIRQMNAPGSPVYRTTENVTIPAILLAVSLLATLYIHTWVGFALLAGGAAWWIVKVLPKVRDGVFDRSAAFALSSEAAFDALWVRGVLSLYARMPDGTERAAAKRQDWRAFVRDLPEG